MQWSYCHGLGIVRETMGRGLEECIVIKTTVLYREFHVCGERNQHHSWIDYYSVLVLFTPRLGWI